MEGGQEVITAYVERERGSEGSEQDLREVHEQASSSRIQRSQSEGGVAKQRREAERSYRITAPPSANRNPSVNALTGIASENVRPEWREKKGGGKSQALRYCFTGSVPYDTTLTIVHLFLGFCCKHVSQSLCVWVDRCVYKVAQVHRDSGFIA